ncbi:hypothetical protein [Pseudoalteromonas sp. OOF1S-7]|uniref:hypothetical protein n=1 Tax=Pseudoalteromonas sp. OOF1S-7 TaxID=2917757 RepID=UPI001EF41D63|nr:hypothetical protein [Pseudoalteromonas sp. OOF1S-7]
MIRDSEREKQQLEHGAAKLFMRSYERLTHTPMRHIWHNQPAKPDVSCYLGEAQLDIEIAHLYASETEAMAVLGRPLSLLMQRELAVMALAPSSQRLATGLSRLLLQKAGKHYHSQRVWLLIRNASPMWHRADFESALPHLTMPAAHPFEQIWLLCDFFCGDPLRLY